jgi:hypothetical protein
MGALLLSHGFDEIKEPRIDAMTAVDSGVSSESLIKVLNL